MLLDANCRQWVLSHTKNPAVRDFWRLEFANWSDRQRSEYTQPVLNKVRPFLMSDALRNVLGQADSTIDAADIMRRGRIVIVNLDKMKLGEDDANLLGSLLVSTFQLALSTRPASAAADDCPSFFIFLDEFHSFTTHAFALLLSEARTYKVGFILAHQYLAQLHPKVRAAIFGNCGTGISFRVGADDAAVLAEQLSRPAEQLEQLSQGEVAVRLLRDGDTDSFWGVTELPAHDTYHGRGAEAVNYSNQFYTRPIERVEKNFTRWLYRMRQAKRRVRRDG